MITKELQQLLERQKQESFTNPATATDAEALGILIAHWAEWDGEQIVDTFLAALEDANFHTFRGEIKELWEQKA